ncbi:MAG: hypothetical protein PUB73_00325 [Bacteroidales bacterium]|nr:hypothetical protein [Bacteroidales bacterium]MDY5824205.1 hypothetical protein [Candidatus Coprenecus sp.]
MCKGFLLSLTLLSIPFLQVCARESEKDRQIAVFWNLENFFDTSDDPRKNDDEFTPRGTRHWTYKKFIAKRNGIARTIVSMKEKYGLFPAIVAFAEVENRWVIEELTEKTPLSKLSYKIIHYESPDRRGIDVALIYREELFKVIQCNSISVDQTLIGRPTRDLLRVAGLLDEDSTVIYVAHLPSKISGAWSSDHPRHVVISTLSDSMEKDISSGWKRIIVMGDFNDTPDSQTISYFLKKSPYLRCISMEEFSKEAGTIKYKGRWELIDLAFASEWITHATYNIFDSGFLLEKDNQYLGKKPKRCYNGPVYNAGLSDHLPIVVIL